MRKAHAAENIGCLAELYVLVAHDLDTVTPRIEEIEKSAWQHLHAGSGQRGADRVFVIDDESEMATVIARLSSPLLQGKELIAEIDEGGIIGFSTQLELEQAPVKRQSFVDVADLQGNMVHTHRAGLLCFCHGQSPL